MPRPYKLTGANSPESRQEVDEFIASEREKAREDIEGEMKKTPDQERTIEIANDVVCKVMKNLGMEASTLSKEQVRLFDEKGFTKVANGPSWELSGFADIFQNVFYVKAVDRVEPHLFLERLEEHKKDLREEVIEDAHYDALEELELTTTPDEGTESFATYEKVSDRIIDEKWEQIDQWQEQQMDKIDDINQYEFLRTLVHEALHLQAFQRYKLNIVAEDDEVVDLRRTGYFQYRLRDSAGLFVSLNEAVTERMTQEALDGHSDILVKKNFPTVAPLDADEMEQEEWMKEVHDLRSSTYGYDRNLLKHIIKLIAEKNQDAVEDVWQRFQKSYLTGDSSHLGDIERTFGRGTLKFYASIFPDDLADSYRRELVWEYFNEDDEAKRRVIAHDFEADRIRADRRGEMPVEYTPPSDFVFLDDDFDDFEDDDEFEDDDDDI